MIFEAIKSLCPTAKFGVRNDDYDQIDWWSEDIQKPTKAAVEVEIARLQVANAHVEPRRKEYPSIADQLDTIYHDGLDAWKAQIKAVKDKYPKA